MHYIKYAVNSSLLTLFWLLQKVCGTLDHCFITAHSIHKEGDLQFHFGVIFHKTLHLKQAHITSGEFIHRAFFWPWQAHRQQCICVDDFAGHSLLWASSHKTFSAPTVGLTINLGVGWSRGFPASSIYKCVSISSRTVLLKRSMVTLDVKFLHHLQSTPLLHEYSGPIISAMLGSIPGSPFLELCQVPAAIPIESVQCVSNRRPFIRSFSLGKRKKPQGVRSGEYGGWGITVMLFLAKNCETLKQSPGW